MRRPLKWRGGVMRLAAVRVNDKHETQGAGGPSQIISTAAGAQDGDTDAT